MLAIIRESKLRNGEKRASFTNYGAMFFFLEGRFEVSALDTPGNTSLSSGLELRKTQGTLVPGQSCRIIAPASIHSLSPKTNAKACDNTHLRKSRIHFLGSAQEILYYNKIIQDNKS